MNYQSWFYQKHICVHHKYSIVLAASRCIIQSAGMPNEFSSYYILPKNTSTFASTQTAHHNPTHWPNLMKFNLHRFIDDDKPVVPYAFLAFIHGLRNCLGQHLAILESKIILSRLTQKYEFTFVDYMKENLKDKGYDPGHRNMVLVEPKDGFVSVFVKRKEI